MTSSSRWLVPPYISHGKFEGGVEGPYYPVVDFFDVGSDMTLGMNHEESVEDAPMTISANPIISAAPSQLLLLTSSLCYSAFLLLMI